MKMCPVVHFEMPAADKARVKKFYEDAFGWEMKQMDANVGNYILATTSPVDAKGMHKRKGAINGGFFEKSDQNTMPHLVISVDDIKSHMQVVTKAGGKILGDVMDIPGVGKFAMISDSEGNHIGMLQPTMSQG